MRNLAVLLLLLMLSAHPGSAAFDPCWDSTGGCFQMPSPPVMSDPSPSNVDRSSDGGNGGEPSYPAGDRDQNRASGIDAEQALVNRRRLAAWRKAREKEVDDQIGALIASRKAEIDRLARSVAVWQKVSEKLAKGKNVEKEFEDWIEESKEAEDEAIRASITLAAGAWGERAARAKDFYERAEKTFFKLHKELLDAQSEAEALAAKCVNDPKLAKALNELAGALRKAQQTLGDANVEQLYAVWNSDFYEAMDTVLKLARYPGAVEPESLKTMQQVDALLAKISAISIDNLLDAGVDKLLDEATVYHVKNPNLTAQSSEIEKYLDDWTIYLRFTRFAGDYGLAMFRFGTAWSQINDLRDAIDSDNEKIDLAAERIKQDTDAKQSRKNELEWLTKSKKYSLEEKERVIAAFHRFGRDRGKELSELLRNIHINQKSE